MKKQTQKLISVTLCVLFLIILLTSSAEADTSNTLTDSGISYTENLENIQNPERGFYTTNLLRLQETGNTPVTDAPNNLIQLKVDISDFSGAINGVADKELSSSALDALAETLKNEKNNNNSVILRFIYDAYCDGIQTNEGIIEDGKKRIEPSIEMIERHIVQLKPIFEQYSDVIYTVQMGFFGAYGELHSTTMCRQENYNRAINALLANTPNTVSISVRTPSQYAGWANIPIGNIDSNMTVRGQHAYRIGIFNDGYLGSKSDLGTYVDREKEITWLKNQANHTPYGGEAVVNYDDDAKIDGFSYMGYYSSIENIEKEAFLTHTSYLNYEWNQNLHNDWKNVKYNGSNQHYLNAKKQDGTDITAYDYINNHLGYRLVLRKSELLGKVETGKTFYQNITIENVGFAPVIKNKKISLIFENSQGNVAYQKILDWKIQDFESQKKLEKKITIQIPENMSVGNYKVYLQIYTGNLENGEVYLPIQLANKDVWNASLKANYMGSFEIVQKKDTENQDSKQTSNPTTDKSTDNSDNDKKDDAKSNYEDQKLATTQQEREMQYPSTVQIIQQKNTSKQTKMEKEDTTLAKQALPNAGGEEPRKLSNGWLKAVCIILGVIAIRKVFLKK